MVMSLAIILNEPLFHILQMLHAKSKNFIFTAHVPQKFQKYLCNTGARVYRGDRSDVNPHLFNFLFPRSEMWNSTN